MVANGGGWVIRFCRWPRAPGRDLVPWVTAELGDQGGHRWRCCVQLAGGGAGTQWAPGGHRDLVPRVAAELGA